MLTAKGQYYKVKLDGVQQSQHTTEREAIEKAIDVGQLNPGKRVTYVHDYEVEVDVSKLRRVIDDIPPTIPANNAVQVVSLTQLDQDWDPSTDNFSGVKEYDVRRNGVIVATLPFDTTGYSHTGLTGNTQYTLEVRARDVAGNNSGWSVAAIATTADNIAPSKPTIGLPTVISGSVLQVPLVVASTDQGGSGLASYQLQRATNSAFTQGLVTTTVPGSGGFPSTQSGLASGTSYFFRARGVDGSGNVGPYSDTVTGSTSSGLAWQTDIPEQDLPFNAPGDSNLPGFLNQAPQVITVEAGGVPGYSINPSTLHYTGTCTQEGTFDVTFNADDNSDEAETAAAKAQMEAAGGILWNFSTSQFPGATAAQARASMMAHLQSIEDECPTNGPKWAVTGISSADEHKYDPPAPGEFAKVDLVRTPGLWLTGGQALATRLHPSEGSTERGPYIEIPIRNPGPVNYYRAAFYAEPEVYSTDFGSGAGRKLMFLDHFGAGAGQMVLILDSDIGPYICLYRFNASAEQIELDWSNASPLLPLAPPGGDGSRLRRQKLTAIDMGPQGSGGTTDANNGTLCMNRRGPFREHRDPNGAIPTAIERVGPYWVGLTIMTDQSWMGAVSRGMLKIWVNHKVPGGSWTQPQLQQFMFRDMRMKDFATRSARSFRPVFRPENASVAVSSPQGIIWDQVGRSPTPPKHIGGFDLPYPGQIIPPGYPLAGGAVEN